MSDVMLNIRSTQTYKQVCKEIEPVEAYRELLKVVMWKMNCGTRSTRFLDQPLVQAFDWEHSPQRRRYWQDINDKTKGRE